MAARDTGRTTEGLLALGAMGILLLTFWFVYQAKSTAPPPESVFLPTTTPKQMRQRLDVSREDADRIVAYREKVGGFDSADNVLKTPGVDREKLRSQLGRMTVRTGETVFWRFWTGAVLLLLTTFLLPAFIRSRIGSGDPYLLPLTLLLAGFGVALLFSLKDPLHDGLAFLHHLRGIGIAIVGLLCAALLPPVARNRIRNYRYILVFVSAGLVAALLLFGRGPEGVKINLFGIQPVEIVKLLLIFFLAGYLADRASLIADKTPGAGKPTEKKLPVKLPSGMTPRLADLGPVAVMYGFALTLFFVVRDLGPGLLLFATFIAVLYMTTGRTGFIWTGITLILFGGLLGYARHIGVFATRVDMWLHPFVNTHPNGMQLGQGYWAMATGGWEGSGLGLGLTDSIPRGGSDLAFASWAEETGLFGAWLLLILFTVLVWRGLKIAVRANTEFDRALAFGLTTLLGLQALLILCGVTGVLPLSGIALPFLSYGNSALLADFVLIGLLRAISVPPRIGVGRDAPRPEVRLAALRFGTVFTLALLGGIGLIRLGAIQLIQADAIATRPIQTPDADKVVRDHQNPRLLAIEYKIERGSIYDRQGRVLATSRAEEIRKTVPDKAEAQRLIAARERYYPYGEACAHLVGYLDARIGGPFGMEKGYNADLRGFQTHAELLRDYRAQHLPGYVPRLGQDVHLTIDAETQKAVLALLRKRTNSLKDKRNGKTKDRAAFVLLDPQSGDTLAAVTLPTFDPNTLTPEQMAAFRTGPDAALEARFINRAVVGVYPPGSTLKVATAACALDNLPNAADFAVECNQVDPEIRWRARGVSYVRRNTRDDKGDPNFGRLGLANAFRVSSNIYFANLAVELGPDRFRKTLADKMFFRYTPAVPKFDADLPDLGYGQGRMLASPLEMARLAGTVANGGIMMKPRFATRIASPGEKQKGKAVEQESLGDAMKPTTAATLRELMRSVVERGTARGVFDTLPVKVAGKTGTAENEQADKEPHSWFIGFAPYSVPLGEPNTNRYAFACVVENGGYGKKGAAVVCRDVLRWLYSH